MDDFHISDAARHLATWQPIALGYPGLQRVSADPPLYAVPGFLTPAECDALIAAAAPGLHRSIVVDGAAGQAPAPSRTSESCYLLKSDTAWLAAKVAALLGGAPPACQEPPQVARYTAGQFYLPHFDAFDLRTQPGRECVHTGGQRTATVLMYLNDVPQPAGGGCTHFPKLEARFAPALGAALVFFPCSLDGRLDPRALHAAEPVTAPYEKWVSQIWLRQREYR